MMLLPVCCLLFSLIHHAGNVIAVEQHGSLNKTALRFGFYDGHWIANWKSICKLQGKSAWDVHARLWELHAPCFSPWWIDAAQLQRKATRRNAEQRRFLAETFKKSHFYAQDVDDALGNFSLTLGDTLDTLVVLGEFDEFERAVRLAIEGISFDSDLVVSVFETNIRMVGGLISGAFCV